MLLWHSCLVNVHFLPNVKQVGMSGKIFRPNLQTPVCIFCSSHKYITQQKSATVGLKLEYSRGQSQTWLLYFPVTWPLHEQDVVFNQEHAEHFSKSRRGAANRKSQLQQILFGEIFELQTGSAVQSTCFRCLWCQQAWLKFKKSERDVLTYMKSHSDCWTFIYAGKSI